MRVDDERRFGTWDRGEIRVVRWDKNGMGETRFVLPVSSRK